MRAVASVRGLITMTDGSTAEFIVLPDSWGQWGHSGERPPADFIEALDALARGLHDEGLFDNIEDDDDTEDDDTEDEEEES